MDTILPETLLEILESIGKRNFCTGFKIYSSGNKTNIVIHFLESSNLINNQQSGTLDCDENNVLSLKSACSAVKKRSPCNQIRDQNRVLDHVKDTIVKDNCIQEPSLDCSNSTSPSTPEVCKQTDSEIEIKDSGIDSTLDNISEEEKSDFANAKTNTAQVEDNTEPLSASSDSVREKKLASNSSKRNQNFNKHPKRNIWPRSRPTGDWRYYGDQFGRFGYRGPYVVPEEHLSPRLQASLDEIDARFARARGYYDT